jgi:hypothetical protein
VLVTTVCWYASSVTAVPTHPIRNPLRFRSMPPPLLASCPRCQLLSGFSAWMDAVACGDETKDLGAGDGELKQKSQRLRRRSGATESAYQGLGRSGCCFSLGSDGSG